MPTREENRTMWDQQFDWSRRGEEWTVSRDWWRSILDATLVKYARTGQSVLEIGPGAGRFTEELIAREPRRLVLLDLSPRCLEMCRERFGDLGGRLECVLGDGRSVPIDGARAFDFIFSFDVFVHVEKPEVEAYFADFARLLVPGGIGIIHYASIDRTPHGRDPLSGWRARFRSTDMHAVLAANNLTLLEDLYDEQISHANSSIAVFRRPFES